MIEIKNKILKSELVEWKKLKFIQSESFKKLKADTFAKLKQSLIENNFIESFKVWEHDKIIYCLDGYHRIKAFKDIEKYGHRGNFYKIPKKFQADFIDCKNEKEASKLILVYSSQYAKINQSGLEQFINLTNLDLSDIEDQIAIPNIKLENLSLNNDEEIEAIEKEIIPYKKTHILLSYDFGKIGFKSLVIF